VALTALEKRGLQEPPYKEPVLDERGFLTPAWQRWINEIYIRMGKKQALNNEQLETLLTELDVRVVALEP